jgi:hypothetical protein
MILLLLACLPAMVSCDKQEEIDRSYTDYRYDIVTYLGRNDRGAVFEYLGRDDSIAVKLQSQTDVDQDIKANNRVLLRYNFVDRVPADSRDIEVYSCNSIFSDSLRQTQAAPDSLPRHAVKLRSLWRTGEFINLFCQLEYTNKARTLMLVADGKTLENDTVDCYLVHDLRGERGTFWRDCYASFNVGALWKRSYFKCLRIHLNDVTYPNTPFYDFNK